jgi:hypothetical protein
VRGESGVKGDHGLEIFLVEGEAIESERRVFCRRLYCLRRPRGLAACRS